MHDRLAQMRPDPITPIDPAAATQELMYRITHDLSASIRSVAQISGWIAEDLTEADIPLPDDAESNIALLQTRATKLQMLLRELLAFSCVGQDGPPFCGDWGRILRDLRGDIPKLQDFRLRTTLHATPALTRADLYQLTRVLVANAVVHHDAGQGCVHLVADNTEPRCMTLQVADDGPGFPLAFQDHLCAPLTHMHARPEILGCGMGLATADKIVRHYGGTLDIADRARARGCLVTVTLPSAL